MTVKHARIPQVFYTVDCPLRGIRMTLAFANLEGADPDRQTPVDVLDFLADSLVSYAAHHIDAIEGGERK